MTDNQNKQVPEQQKKQNQSDKVQFPYIFLFSGKSLEIGKYKIKHPTINDILSIPNTLNYEEVYWSMVTSLLSDPYESMVKLWDMGIDYEDITPFGLFVMNWKNKVELYEKHKEEFDKEKIHPLDNVKKALSFFMGDRDWELAELFDGNSIIYDKNDLDYQITEDVYNVILEFIKSINCIEYKDRIKPKNKFVKEMLIEDMRDEQRSRENNPLNKEEKINVIGSMMSAVCVGGNGSINPQNVLNLSIFQLYKYFVIEQKKTRVDKLLNGIYAGTIDQKNIKENEFKWTD